MAVVDELIAILGYELRGEAALGRFQQGLARAQNGVRSMAVAVARWGTIAAGAATAAFAAQGRSILTTTGEFERYQLILETIEGSAEKARESLAWITEFGATTPYEIAGVTDAFVKLKAYGIDPIADDTLRILGDTASAMGKPLIQAVEALADAQTGEFERMKEFGLKASQAGDEVTFRWTENGKEMTRTVRKNSEEIRRFILENFGERFTGAMDKQSKGWEGMLSNLGDNWTNFKRAIGEAGLFDAAKDRLSGLLDWIAARQADGSWDAWAQRISNAYTSVMDATGSFASRMKGHFDFLANLTDVDRERLMAWWSVWRWVLGGIFVMTFPVLSVLIALGLAVDDFLTYLQGGESVIGQFIENLQALIPVSENAALAIAGFGAGIGIAALLRPVAAIRGVIGILRGVAVVAAGLVALIGGVPALIVAAIAGIGIGLYAWWDEIVAWWDGTVKPKFAEWKAQVAELTGVSANQVAVQTARMAPEFHAGRDDYLRTLEQARLQTNERYRAEAGANDLRAALAELSSLWKANTANMSGEAAAQEIVNDSRDQSSHVQVSVTQNVALTEASAAAAGAVAQATGSAAAGAATPARATGGGYAR